MAAVLPTSAHVALMDDLKAALGRHAHLTGQEMLALTAQLVGNLITYQDQTRYTVDQIMEMVTKNIEIGNQAALELILGPGGTA